LAQASGLASPIRQRWVRGDKQDVAPGLTASVLWPPAGEIKAHNLDCLAFQLAGKNGNFLFLGDLPAAAEQQLWLERCCGVLKVGHHGSARSSCEELLLRASPLLAVSMPGSRNPFGFPAQETVARLKRFADTVLDTKAQGAIEVSWNSTGRMRWRTWK
jgi:competence protein ComEC